MRIEGLEPGTSSSGGLLLDHLSHNGCCKEEESLTYIPICLQAHKGPCGHVIWSNKVLHMGQIDQNKHENQSY